MVGPALINQVRAALERDPDINLHRFPMEISHRGTLCLEGEVENIVAKRRALQIAREVAGTQEIHDHLRVQVGQKRDGDGLRAAVLSALMEEPVFRGFAILDQDQQPPEDEESNWLRVAVRQESSMVHLEGAVWSLPHRRLAEVIAWWVPGTADVDNRIRVRPAEQDNDDDLTDTVRMVLDKDPSFDAEEIFVRARDRVITLEGTVSSEVNRRIACYDCWYIPGVHGVENRLQVRERMRNG